MRIDDVLKSHGIERTDGFKPNNGYLDRIFPIAENVTLNKNDLCSIRNGKAQMPDSNNLMFLDNVLISTISTTDMFDIDKKYSIIVLGYNKPLTLIEYGDEGMQVYNITHDLGSRVTYIKNIYKLSNGKLLIFGKHNSLAYTYMIVAELDVINKKLTTLQTTTTPITYSSYDFISTRLIDNVFAYATYYPGNSGTTVIYGVFVNEITNTITVQQVGTLSNTYGRLSVTRVSDNKIAICIQQRYDYKFYHSFAHIEKDNCWNSGELAYGGNNLAYLFGGFCTKNFYCLKYEGSIVKFNISAINNLTSGQSVPTTEYSVISGVDAHTYSDESNTKKTVDNYFGTIRGITYHFAIINTFDKKILYGVKEVSGELIIDVMFIDKNNFNNMTDLYTIKGFTYGDIGRLVYYNGTTPSTFVSRFTPTPIYNGIVIGKPTITTVKVRLSK